MRCWWLAALMLVPPAAAEFTVQLEAPSAPIQPETGKGNVTATFSMDCPTALAWAPPGMPGTLAVAFNVSGAPQATWTVTGPSTVLLDSQACLDAGATHAVAHGAYLASFTREAPGLVPLPLVATVDGRAGLRGDPVHATATAAVRNGYAPIIQAAVEHKQVEVAAGHAASLEVVVRNFGNAATRITFEVDPLEGWTATAPQPIVLDAATAGQATSATVTLVVQTARDGAWTNAERNVALRLTPAAASDGSLTGVPIQVGMQVTARGFSAPAPGAVEAIVLLAAALLARRRAP